MKPSSLAPFRVGDVLPMRMNQTEMRRAFPVNGRAMSISRFYQLEVQGKFRRFECPSLIGCKAWSGAKVARYMGTDAPTAPITERRNLKAVEAGTERRAGGNQVDHERQQGV